MFRRLQNSTMDNCISVDPWTRGRVMCIHLFHTQQSRTNSAVRCHNSKNELSLDVYAFYPAGNRHYVAKKFTEKLVQ